MKKFKKAFALALALVLCLNMGVSAASTEVSISDPDENGLVTISGNGEVPDNALFSDNTYAQKMITLTIEEGITNIGNYAFSGSVKLTTVYLPITLTNIESGAFNKCSALTTVYYAGNEEDAAALYDGTTLNTALDSATWVYNYTGDSSTEDDTTPVELGFSISDVSVVQNSTATVYLRVSESCTRLGATFTVKATGPDGAELSISNIEPNTGCANAEKNGCFVLAEEGTVTPEDTLAAITFSTTGAAAGDYTVTIEGDAYTGNNVPVTLNLTPGKVTVLEPQVTITWKNGDDVLESGPVERGSTPTYGGKTPTKASTRLYSYTFAGWNKEVVPATEDATYTAKFTENVRSYSVSFDCGIDGAEYSVKDSGGTEVSAGENGLFTLSATETYTVSVSAVGYIEKSVEFSIAEDSDGLTVDQDAGTAALSIDEPEKRIGDVDNDGDVDATDAQALYSYLAGNITLSGDGIAYNESGNIIFNSNVADISGQNGISADDILPMLDLINKQAQTN